MSLYNIFATDKSAEQDGIWVDYGDAGRIKIARMGGSNSAYTKAVANLYKANKHAIDTDTMSDEVAEKKQREIFAKHVVLDWDNGDGLPGLPGPEGELLDFTQENVVKVLSDLPDLYADLRAQAAKVSNFRKAAIEADAKN